MSKPTGLELANMFSNFVNGSNSHEHEEFIEGFKCQHRTLQQSMVRTMMATIEHCASEDYRTDGRNEGSKVLAQKLIKGFKMVILEEFASNHLNELPTENDKSYVASEHCMPSKFLGFV